MMLITIFNNIVLSVFALHRPALPFFGAVLAVATEDRSGGDGGGVIINSMPVWRCHLGERGHRACLYFFFSLGVHRDGQCGEERGGADSIF